MASIWFVNAGTPPERHEAVQGGLALSECIEKLDLRPEYWIADLESPPGFMMVDPRPDLAWMREAEIVIVIVDEDEVSRGFASGLYQLPLSPRQAASALNLPQA
jgi:hypothetical protein